MVIKSVGIGDIIKNPVQIRSDFESLMQHIFSKRKQQKNNWIMMQENIPLPFFYLKTNCGFSVTKQCSEAI